MLSQKLIIEKAKEMVHEEGLEKLSMRNLATKLNVKAMSLYNHIKNKDHLIDLLLDDVISQITLPKKNGNWQDEMIKRAVSSHEVFLENPWSLMPFLSRINSGPSMLLFIEHSLSCLNEAGFTLPEADRILNYFDSYIYGFTLIKLKFPIKEENYLSTTEEMLPILDAKDYPAINKLSHLLLQGEYDGKQDFVSGFRAILIGLEMKLNNKRR